MIEAGLDEAGRGPLAGPVYAAAVILDKKNSIVGLNDSKKISEKNRELIAKEIKAKAISWSIGASTALEIDQFNILRASLLAMKRALECLEVSPDLILVDGIHAPDTKLIVKTH